MSNSEPVPVLTGSNFVRWRMRIRCLLEARELDGIVFGYEQEPLLPEATGQQDKLRVELKQFKLKDCKARAVLTAALDDDHLSLIVACRTARQIWDRIEDEYSDQAPSDTAALLSQFYTLKMESGSSVSQYVAKIDSLVCRMTELGKDIDEDAVIAKIISGLPLEYRGFSRAWNMTAPENRTKKLLVANLKLEEKALGETAGEALVAKSAPGRSSNQDRGKRNRLSKQEIQDRKRKSICKWCKETGHWWRECPKRPEGQEPSDTKKQTRNSKPSGKPELAMLAKFGHTGEDTNWYIDSGASEHMSGVRDWFDDFERLEEPIPIEVGNKQYLHAVAKGSIRVTSTVGTETIVIRLKNVHYVPNISTNLFSIGAADAAGTEVRFRSGIAQLVNNNRVVATGSKAACKLYKLNVQVPLRAKIARSERTIEEWHDVLGHADKRQIEKMANQGLAKGIKIVETPKRLQESCLGCQMGKGKCVSHPDSHRERAKEKLERIHVDLVGKVSPTSYGGSNYFLLIKDECTNYMFAEPISSKQHISHVLARMINGAEILGQSKVKIIRSDQGSEFKNALFKFYCDANNIIHEFSAAYTPQQNGLAERANETVIETARAMLQTSGLPLELWSEAVNTAVYVRNRICNTRTGDKTPFELFHGSKPDLSHLVRFGQPVQILEQSRHVSKFEPRTIDAYVIGYDPNNIRNYRCLIRGTKNVLVTPNVAPANHYENKSSPAGSTFGDLCVHIGDAATKTTTPDHAHSEYCGKIIAESESESLPGDRLTQAGTEHAAQTAPNDAGASITIDEKERSAQHLLRPVPERSSSLSSTISSRDFHSARLDLTLTSDDEEENTSQIKRSIDSPDLFLDKSPIDKYLKSILKVGPRDKSATMMGHTRRQADARTTDMRQSFEHADENAHSSAPTGALSPRSTNVDNEQSSTASVSRTARLTNRLYPILNLSTDRPQRVKKPPSKLNLSMVTVEREPTSFSEAINSFSGRRWREGIDAELAAHAKLGTWEVVDKPPKCKEITAKWVFKLKDDDDGNPRYKARLVARGFSQREGTDFKEIFAPVVRMESVRLLFALAVQTDLIYTQFDVTTAFLNGTVEEELYMSPPEGLEVDPGKTLRLRRSLYGLRQAPRCWNKCFTTMLSRFKLKQSTSDPCVFTGTASDPLYLALYVDDGLIFAKHKATIDALVRYLKEAFEVKEVTSGCFLGVQIERQNDGSIFLHQTKYISRVLDRYGMLECSPVKTPLEVGHSLHRQEILDSEVVTDKPYAEALGSLLYCAMATRPDICHALSILSKYASSPRQAHWIAVKRVIRYLKGTSSHGLWYNKVDNPSLQCYSDADWAGDHANRKSTTGMITFINSGPISYKAQQQSVVALSTTEAEYISASVAVQELIWLRRFLSELNPTVCKSALLLCDNQSALKLMRNPEFHQRTKHIDIRYHFIRDQLERGLFEPQYVQTANQKADIFTKALTADKHNALCKMIGCINGYNPNHLGENDERERVLEIDVHHSRSYTHDAPSYTAI